MRLRPKAVERDMMKEYEVSRGRRDFIRWCLMAGVAAEAPWWPLSRAEGATRVGDVLPGATLTGLKGARVEIPSDYQGKIVVIHFFATWCANCAKEAALLESLHERYKAKGVAPLSINVGEARETVASFMEKQKISYPVLMDSNASAARQYGVSGIPTTFVLDRRGVVRFRIVGEVNSDGLQKIVRSLL